MGFDLQAKIEKAKAKAAEEIAKLETEAIVRDWFDGVTGGVFSDYKTAVHQYPLYGVDATYKLEHDFFDYRNKRPPVTLATVEALADFFPPVPYRMMRCGCLSFRTAADVDAMTEKERDAFTSEVDVCGFRVKVSAYQRLQAKFEWATVSPVGVVEIEVVLPLPPMFARYEMRRREYHGKIVSITDCRLIPGQSIQWIMRDDVSVAQLESPIKWARGADDVANDYTLYWVDLADDQDPVTAGDLVRSFHKAQALEAYKRAGK
jgi:hypothetical protein